ncbi:MULTISPECIES: hypothetical protein [Komagataeibacter]|uniref:Uncharacterized protein n=1 Tax=Komagataeibacter melaceti TaxID=2766577 RepID=A0A371YXF2_9PROT|nr:MULTISPECIES: hypothetical protein [Komagataeibacter]MCE2576699.1 hypothetical protein [Komagataeibacter sp. FNDCR2]RFD18904.1 hypothetical protein DY926_14205 [Komagataeibacter melaceti]
MIEDTPPDLRPASLEEIEASLSHGLRYDGRRKVHTADEMMARITAERLVAYLQACGYVILRRTGAPAPSTSAHHHPHAEPG